MYEAVGTIKQLEDSVPLHVSENNSKRVAKS